MAHNDTPQKWASTTLGEIVPYGKTQKCVLEDVTDETWVLELEDIEKDCSKVLSHKEAKERPFKSTKNRFKEGDVLYGKLRPYLNKVVVADRDGVCSTEIIPLDAEPFVFNRYLFYWLKTRDFLNYVNDVSYGVNMPRLGTKDGVAAPFVLAPLAEQKAIAEKLDTLLAQVENTKARLEGIPKILKRFRQSVLAAAVSGKLTEDWRGTKAISFQQPPITIGRENEEVPEGWAWNDLVDLAKLESGHTPRKSRTDYWENGDVPWISLQDIRAAHGSVIEKTKFMPNMKGIENSSARILPKGTVCFSRDISVGYTTIMGCEMATTQHFVNWICSPDLNNYYLMYAFMAAKDHLTISGQGSTVKTIYMPACKKFRLITPPLDEQTEIVRRVDQLFAYADTIETQVNNALDRVNNLTQSILAKAFRGELTEQWRQDNPDLISGENSAEALLEKIKAERAASKPVKRGRKTVKQG
ncbi:restriction endonuclease subunit S [Alcanivorax sp.]|uniref:restriction endonuclease subunit S n=1 Tax=Alcanivorax sp. TaxID=1872427 RepID=UPI0026330E2B|nr:restriction endonuclease subunit S [Alcanivorax sp.]